jgi:hypothetical protein
MTEVRALQQSVCRGTKPKRLTFVTPYARGTRYPPISFIRGGSKEVQPSPPPNPVHPVSSTVTRYKFNPEPLPEAPGLDALLADIDGKIEKTPTAFYFSRLPQDSEDWHALRNNHLKLSGSEFGAALGVDESTSRQLLWRRKRTPHLVAPFSDYTLKILQWGKDNESVALDNIKKYYGRLEDWFDWQIQLTGTWVFKEDPTMGSTPDALLFADDGMLEGILEIKCPFTRRIYPSLLATPYPFIKSSHYIQVLMEMKVTGVKVGYYVCWTPERMVVVQVPYNQDLADEVFYKCKVFKGFNLGISPSPPPRMNAKEKSELEERLKEGQNLTKVIEVTFPTEEVKYPVFKTLFTSSSPDDSGEASS